MRAAYFRGNGLIEFADVPTPHIGPGEVCIRVAANGVCGSDHKALDGGPKTRRERQKRRNGQRVRSESTTMKHGEIG